MRGIPIPLKESRTLPQLRLRIASVSKSSGLELTFGQKQPRADANLPTHSRHLNKICADLLALRYGTFACSTTLSAYRLVSCSAISSLAKKFTIGNSGHERVEFFSNSYSTIEVHFSGEP